MTDPAVPHTVPLVQDPEGWIAAADLVSGERLETLFEMPRRLWNAPLQAAAVLAWKTYTYRLLQPLATAWARAREIPLLSADNILIRILPATPYIRVALRHHISAVLPTGPAAHSGDALVLPDEAGQLAFLRATLIDQHLRPLVERTMEIRRVGERVLWGQAAAAIAYAFADVSPGAAEDADRFTELLPVRGLAGIGADDTVWRTTCCLAFCSPTLSTCRDCVTAQTSRSAVRAASARTRSRNAAFVSSS